MYLPDHARLTPNKPALISADSGDVVTYAQLDERSNRVAQLLKAHGLKRGDHIAVLMENNLSFMDPVWAAFRSGLYVTTINRYLPPDEAAYIVNDCGAKALVTSFEKRETAAGLADLIPGCAVRLMVGGTIPGWTSYEDAVAAASPEPLESEWMGDSMLYSSGTTGRPKGILRPLPDISAAEGFAARQLVNRYDLTADSVYLSPAPLYHAAPLAYVLSVQSFGGTVVMMERFDAERALQLIEQYGVTHSQWVPTMFVRMLKLDPEVRARHDLSSHKVAIHAAAPCPVEVKREMIGWWGPILYEYYAGTEGSGSTFITSEDWLAHPGSVGRAALGVLHICDENGVEVAAGTPGRIFARGPHCVGGFVQDPAATEQAWATGYYAMGDFGHLDQDGYLWLAGRVRELVIRGGQNIVPAEVEDATLAHPHVAEAAVIGVPDAEMGERVCAAVVPRDGVRVTLESITAHLSERGLARFKHPERLFLIDALPLNPAATKVDKRALLEMALGKEIKDSSAEVSQASTRIANRSIRRKR